MEAYNIIHGHLITVVQKNSYFPSILTSLLFDRKPVVKKTRIHVYFDGYFKTWSAIQMPRLHVGYDEQELRNKVFSIMIDVEMLSVSLT